MPCESVGPAVDLMDWADEDNPSVDKLTTAMHRLSLLESMADFYQGRGLLLSPAFLWLPAPPHNVTTYPFWPNLTSLDLAISPIISDGRFRFTPHPPRAEDGNTSGLAAINPLLLAIARASLRMPSLRRLKVDVSDPAGDTFRVQFLAAVTSIQGSFVDLPGDFDHRQAHRSRWYIWTGLHRSYDGVAIPLFTLEMPWDMPMNIRDVMRDKVGPDGLVATASAIAEPSRILTVKVEWPKNQPLEQVPLARPPEQLVGLFEAYEQEKYRRQRVQRMKKVMAAQDSTANSQ